MPGRDDEVASDHMVEGMAYAAGRDDVKVCVSLKGLVRGGGTGGAGRGPGGGRRRDVDGGGRGRGRGVGHEQWQQQWRQRGPRGVNSCGCSEMAVCGDCDEGKFSRR